jgi:hypothetical protein
LRGRFESDSDTTRSSDKNPVKKGETDAHTARWLTGALLTMPVTMGRIPSASAQSDEALEYYHQAKINWRQAEGQSLTIGLNKHPFS